MTSKLKKFLKILGIIIAVLAVVFILFLVWVRIQINRGNLVKWDGEWYTKEKLAEKFPPQYIEIEAKNTPEEVYKKFRQALLDNDLETALEQIREERREEYREIFSDYQKKNGDLKNLGKVYPIEINKSHEYGNFSSFNYKFVENEKEFYSSIEFEKNSEGYWQIDRI